MRPPVQRLVEQPEVAHQRGGGIQVKRRPDRGRDFGDRDVFGKELPVLVDEMIHGGALAQSAQGGQPLVHRAQPGSLVLSGHHSGRESGRESGQQSGQQSGNSRARERDTMHAAIQNGNVAVITGGASGIGHQMARRLVDLGLRVCIADLPGETLENAVSPKRAPLWVSAVMCQTVRSCARSRPVSKTRSGRLIC